MLKVHLSICPTVGRSIHPSLDSSLKVELVLLPAVAPDASRAQRSGEGSSHFLQALGSRISTAVLASLLVASLLLLVAVVLYFTRKKKAEDRKFLLDSSCS